MSKLAEITYLIDADDSDAGNMPVYESPIDFKNLAGMTQVPETDLRVAYETNPSMFVKDYYFSLDEQPIFHTNDLLFSSDESVLALDDVLDIGVTAKGFSYDKIDTFAFANPDEHETINGFINIGEHHDRVDLSALLDQLGPSDSEHRAERVHLSQHGEHVHLSIDGLPEFGVTFVDSASNYANDFVIGTDILV